MWSNIFLIALSAFIVCMFIYYITRSITMTAPIIVIYVICSVMFFIFFPLATDVFEEQEAQSLSMDEIQLTGKPGEILNESFYIIITPNQNESLSYITFNISTNFPYLEEYNYNSEEKKYLLLDSNLSNNNTEILFYKGNTSFKIKYIDNITITNKTFPIFPINNETTINVTMIANIPYGYSKETLFKYSKDLEYLKYDFNEVTPEENIFDYDFLSIILIILSLVIILFFIKEAVEDHIDNKKRIDMLEKRFITSISENTKQKVEEQKPFIDSKYGKVMKKRDDYTLSTLTTADKALEKAKEYRDLGYWVKIENYSKNISDNFNSKKCCAVYISNWSQDEFDEKGHPSWK